MDPIFPKWSNKLPLYLTITFSILFVGIISLIWYYASPKFLNVGYQPKQPIAFSHKLHAGEMGIDCRYCHSTVQKTSFSAIPTTSTCMGCHNKVKLNSPRLELLRQADKNKQTIPWVRIHALPRYVHFDHSAHLNAGVGCVSCHGRVDRMEQVSMKSPLSMGWCLECHKNPTPYLRPQSQLTNMLYDPLKSKYSAKNDRGRKENLIQPPTACGACHY